MAIRKPAPSAVRVDLTLQQAQFILSGFFETTNRGGFCSACGSTYDAGVPQCPAACLCAKLREGIADGVARCAQLHASAVRG